MRESVPRFRICLVCAGNICRSPIAEVVLRRHFEAAGLADAVTVESAGTGGWHVGEPADRRALAVLRQHGYDGDAHRARQFSRDWFHDVDLVLALDQDNAADLRRTAPDAAQEKVRLLREYDPAARAAGDTDVPDPYYDSDDSFGEVLAMVERAAAGLVDAVHAELTRAPARDGESHRR